MLKWYKVIVAPGLGNSIRAAKAGWREERVEMNYRMKDEMGDRTEESADEIRFRDAAYFLFSWYGFDLTGSFPVTIQEASSGEATPI